MNEHLEPSDQAVELLETVETDSAEQDVRNASAAIDECVFCGHWPCGCGG